MVIFIVALCQKPIPPQHGILEPLLREQFVENSEVTYKCKRGFEPRDQFTAVCMRDTTWSPSPADHNCTGITQCYRSNLQYIVLNVLFQMWMNAYYSIKFVLMAANA